MHFGRGLCWMFWADFRCGHQIKNVLRPSFAGCWSTSPHSPYRCPRYVSLDLPQDWRTGQAWHSALLEFSALEAADRRLTCVMCDCASSHVRDLGSTRTRSKPAAEANAYGPPLIGHSCTSPQPVVGLPFADAPRPGRLFLAGAGQPSEQSRGTWRHLTWSKNGRTFTLRTNLLHRGNHSCCCTISAQPSQRYLGISLHMVSCCITLKFRPIRLILPQPILIV